MSFRDALANRSATVYADFLVPHLTASTRLLDCGCGTGSITVGLAGFARWIVGLDLTVATLEPAVTHLAEESIRNAFDSSPATDHGFRSRRRASTRS